MNDGQEEETRVPRRHPVPSRHAKIMRGIVTPIFGLLAVTCIVFGILNQTIWKPSKDVTALAHVDGTRYAVIDPGVLDLVDKSVQIRVDAASVEPPAATTADDTAANNDANANDGNTDAANEPQTCIAIGSPKDASGWLAGESYIRVTGLDSWSALSTVAEKAHGNASTSRQQVAFADSDMWADTACGKTSAALRLPDAKATQVAIIDFGGNASDATISMHWVRQSVPDFALPWYFAGGLCVILAILSASVFAMDPATRRNRFAKVIKPRKEKEPVEETTTIAAAVAGTFASMKPRKRTKAANGKPRGRHGRHAGAAAAETDETPQIIDPTSRNLVAEQARRADAEDGGEPRSTTSSAASDEATSVITPEELQAYFARLVREETGSIPVVSAETTETTTESAENAEPAAESAETAETAETTEPTTETTESDDDGTGQVSMTVESAESAESDGDTDAETTADTDNESDDNATADDETDADTDADADTNNKEND